MDIKLSYSDTGAGKPLILLHGNGEDRGYFEKQIPVFGERYRVIAPDTRGHGKSPRGEGEMSIKRFSEDLFSFMGELEIRSAVILGFSDGANIALEFALNHPEAVDGLILNGGNLFPGGVKASVQAPIVFGFAVASFLGVFSRGAASHAEILALMVKEPHMEPSALREIKMPTLVIAGTHDMIKESHTRLIGDSIPNSKTVFIEGDHFIAAKNPDAFNAAVLDFLTENGL